MRLTGNPKQMHGNPVGNFLDGNNQIVHEYFHTIIEKEKGEIVWELFTNIQIKRMERFI